MATSQNGWTASPNSSNYVPFRWITGRINKNKDVGIIFEDLCDWFNKNIEPITKAHSWGYAYRVIRAGVRLSNHASGTALDLNAPRHPLGVSGTFSKDDQKLIKAKMKEYGGVVRWGGSYLLRKDDMHFEINASAARCAVLAKKIKSKSEVKPTAPSKPVPDKPKPTTPKPPAKPPVANPKPNQTVKSIQQRLKVIGDYKGFVDGINGSMTKAAIKSYQARQKIRLYADGVWGAKTEKHFNWTKELQGKMNQWKGTKLRVDGDYGQLTANRVKELQKRNHGKSYRGLIDGKVGSIFNKMVGIRNYPN